MSRSAVAMVAVGGAVGSVLRYLTGVWLLRTGVAFPVGTLTVNVVGCFLVTYFARQFAGADQDGVRLLLVTGLCGGFTTFSTFSAETLALVHDGKLLRALAYVTLSLLLGFAGAALGTLVRR